MQDEEKRAFRSALGNFATGVTIVTTRDADGKAVGLTASSFNSVSLEPPMVLWSLALNSPNLAAFRQTKGWAVHILSADQEDLSNRFAARGTDKFAGLEFEDGPEGAPLLPGCAARFGCTPTFEYEGGDHAIFVGKVEHFAHRDVAPLIFHGGKYGRVTAAKAATRPDTIEDQGEFGRYFVGHLLGRAYQAALSDVRREYRKRGLRSSEYTVIASMGLGEGCTREDLVRRAANGKLDLPVEPINQLLQKGLLREVGDQLHLTQHGRKILTELMAVAQSTELHFESSLTVSEMNQLHDLLLRLSDLAPSDG